MTQNMKKQSFLHMVEREKEMIFVGIFFSPFLGVGCGEGRP